MLEITLCSSSQIHTSAFESRAVWSWTLTNSVIGLIIFGTCKSIWSVELCTVVQGFTNCVVLDWVWCWIAFFFLSKRGIHFLQLLLLLCCIFRRLRLISGWRFALSHFLILIDDFRERLVRESSFLDGLGNQGNVWYFNNFLVSLLCVLF